MRKLAVLMAISAGLVASQGWALIEDGIIDGALGTDITAYDGWNRNTSGWYGPQEDQEVDYLATTGQAWDMEAFFLSGGTLTMVGGFDFQDGYQGYHAGDIFIDINGDANVPATAPYTSPQGYDYVLDMNWAALTYNVYALTSSSTVVPVGPSMRQGANPYRYSSGGTLLSSGVSVADYESSVASVGGLTGGSHNVLQFDLSGINSLWPILDSDADSRVDGGVAFHFTLECGNDMLTGRVPDGGATILLLGVALAGLGVIRRIS